MSECPHFRLFGSIDLIGSTSFKRRAMADLAPATGDGIVAPFQSVHWLREFERFYEGIMRLLQPHGWSLVKTIGDEILVMHPADTPQRVLELTLGFRNAIREYDQDSSRQLKAKGCLWIAEFPIINRKISVPIWPSVEDARHDYLGPSIDAGFRLARHASIRRLVVSLELAWLLTGPQVRDSAKDLQFFYEGRIPLEGIFGDDRYPLVWTLVESSRETSEEALRGDAKRVCCINQLHQFCDEFLSKMEDGRWLVRPFFSPSLPARLPAWYRDEATVRKAADEVEENVGHDDLPAVPAQFDASQEGDLPQDPSLTA